MIPASLQAAPAILMVRASRFGFNEQTAGTNAFQQSKEEKQKDELRRLAMEEFDSLVKILRAHKVKVIVADAPSDTEAPDAVFPNNWISFHENGNVVLYPMYAPNRRLERKNNIIDLLKNTEGYRIHQVIDLTGLECENKFLEGTGSIVFDYPHKLAYACLSSRTNEEALKSLTQKIGYDYIAFHATDDAGRAIYHTNVMMNIGEDFAVVCAESIDDGAVRKKVMDTLTQNGHEVIEISRAQMLCFAGNMYQVKNADGATFLVMSERAFLSLRPNQVEAIKKHTGIIYSPLTTIEDLGGGSARCMMAGIFLPGKN